MKLSLLNKEKYSWLKFSLFYRNLDTEEPDALNVIYCSKYSNNIKLYIKVIMFWCVNYCPYGFYELFLYTIKYELLTEKFKLKFFLEKENEKTPSEFFSFLIECINNKYEKSYRELFYIAIKHSQIDFMNFLCAKEKIHKIGSKKYLLSILNSHILLKKNIKYVIGLQKKYFPTSEEEVQENKMISLIDFYVRNSFLTIPINLMGNIIHYDNNIFEIAAANGNPNTFKFLYERRFFFSKKVFEIAIEYGNLEFVKNLLNNMNYRVVYSTYAAMYNQHKILEYFIKKKYEINCEAMMWFSNNIKPFNNSFFSGYKGTYKYYVNEKTLLNYVCKMYVN